jgi:hypothetical protein
LNDERVLSGQRPKKWLTREFGAVVLSQSGPTWRSGLQHNQLLLQTTLPFGIRAGSEIGAVMLIRFTIFSIQLTAVVDACGRDATAAIWQPPAQPELAI